MPEEADGEEGKDESEIEAEMLRMMEQEATGDSSEDEAPSPGDDSSDAGDESAMMDIRDETAIRRILEIPKQYRPFTAISLGYPAQVRKPRPRLPREEIIFFEKFEGQKDGSEVQGA